MKPIKNSLLIVDDEGLNITALTHILGADYTIYVEKDGVGCIETAKEMKPDLILLDVIMPAMDGFEVIKVLKADIKTRDIPVVFVTGLRNAQDEELGFVLGAADYINKPFSSSVVKLRVKNQLQLVNQMKEIRRLSITDPLTEINNRCHFNSIIQQEWQRAARNEKNLSFIILDIDFFKSYNDTNGHLQGDIVLNEVAKLVSSRLLRPADQVSRWGNDEFAIILPETDLEGAFSVAEDIRSTIEKHAFVNNKKDNKITNITASFGVHSKIPLRDDYNLENFVSNTETALFNAKESGRNRVCS